MPAIRFEDDLYWRCDEERGEYFPSNSGAHASNPAWIKIKTGDQMLGACLVSKSFLSFELWCGGYRQLICRNLNT